MNQPEEKIPVFKKWSSWYWLVLSVLMVQVILYYLLTNSY